MKLTLPEKLRQKSKQYTADFLQLIYPEHCYSCQMELVGSPAGVCAVCAIDLEYTLFENYQSETPLDQLFWGRTPLRSTFALLYFNKQGASQKILHELKYKGRDDIGLHYGEEMGERLLESRAFGKIDGLIPVPLHPKKQFIRGYNQAEKIASGMAKTMNVSLRADLLQRSVFAESQTKKGFASRWETIQNNFRSKRGKQLEGHFVLVDDVITTGATLEVCIKALRKDYPNIELSVAALAFAK